MDIEYCHSLFNYQRNKTQSIKIGDIMFGSNFPIRVQSMTNTDTKDITKSTEQSKRIFDAGSHLVRLTIPSLIDIEKLMLIKEELKKSGYYGPISADVHFNSEIAIQAATVVEKVRINPGNFVRSSNKPELSNEEAISIIESRLIDLLNVCVENNSALRIGTNHGSLAERIIHKYGDTAEGMVESTLEYLRIISEYGFKNVVVSLKSSNVLVMVHANRLLVSQMKKEGLNFPLHLGVTEAGEGEDGRIKSAIGIGTLLQDGIGDTVRVSLTEEPEEEIPVCRNLIDYYERLGGSVNLEELETTLFNPFGYKRIDRNNLLNIGSNNKPIVISDISKEHETIESGILRSNFPKDQIPDYIYIGNFKGQLPESDLIPIIIDYTNWKLDYSSLNVFPLLSSQEYLNHNLHGLTFLKLSEDEISEELISKLSNDMNVIILAESNNVNYVGGIRHLIFRLLNNSCLQPVVSVNTYFNIDHLSINSSCDFGPLVIDGLIDGIMISSSNYKESVKTSFGILQATRSRITKPDYISCPGCGRTLFDLQKTSREIREKTSHLKGIKIGIMGCIVNGPGEMADADFGYVGSLKGKVTLYKGKEPVNRNIPEKNAVNELIELIKDNGFWTDPD